ncbi:hypothetical protein FRC08_009020 [Ceratobasidium sp. 394]|nr:hypothetical protein FRC08_009020 [Ceratobasidium sp. 394]
MPGESLGRGHRVIRKTKGLVAHEEWVKDGEDRRDKLKRNKYVREQEAELAAEDEAEDFLAAMRSKPSKSASSKASAAQPAANAKAAKSGSGATSKSKASGSKGGGSAEQEERREQLINLLFYRDKLGRDELGTLTLPVLEKIWGMGEGGRRAASPVETPAKTPAKAAPALSRVSAVKLLGSPLDALRAAKTQAANAANGTPVISRKRRNSSSDLDDLEEVLKRPRVDKDASQGKSSVVKPFKSSSSNSSSLTTSRQTPRIRPSQSKYSRTGSSQPTSRAGSTAPTVISVSSGSMRSAPSDHNLHAGGLPDIDEEMIELSDEEVIKPVRKVKAVRAELEMSKSTKPKCSDYEGVWCKLIDTTYKLVCARLGHDGMFPEQREYDRLVRKSWATAAKEHLVDVRKYPMDQDLETCVKRRIGSYRGRVRDKIKPSIASVYKLSGKKNKKKLAAHVQNLLDGTFHKLPGVAGRSGFYQHPFIAECVYQTYFVGRRPVGVTFPKFFSPIPIPAIAYVAAMVEFLISQYQTGVFKESRAEVGVLAELYDKHLPNISLFQECLPQKCKKYQGELYAYAMRRAGKPVRGSKAQRTGPGVLTRADFEGEDDDADDDGDQRPKKAARRAKPQPRTRAKSPSASGSSSDSSADSSDSDSDSDSSSSSGSGSDSNSDSDSGSDSGSDSDSSRDDGDDDDDDGKARPGRQASSSRAVSAALDAASDPNNMELDDEMNEQAGTNKGPKPAASDEEGDGERGKKGSKKGSEKGGKKGRGKGGGKGSKKGSKKGHKEGGEDSSEDADEDGGENQPRPKTSGGSSGGSDKRLSGEKGGKNGGKNGGEKGGKSGGKDGLEDGSKGGDEGGGEDGTRKTSGVSSSRPGEPLSAKPGEELNVEPGKGSGAEQGLGPNVEQGTGSSVGGGEVSSVELGQRDKRESRGEGKEKGWGDEGDEEGGKGGKSGKQQGNGGEGNELGDDVEEDATDTAREKSHKGKGKQKAVVEEEEEEEPREARKAKTIALGLFDTQLKPKSKSKSKRKK